MAIAVSAFAQGVPQAQRGQRPQQGQAALFQAPQIPEAVVYSARANFSTRDVNGRSYNFGPTFFIFPDTKVDEEGAKALVSQLGIQPVLDANFGSLYVINPVGAKYADSDFSVFEEVFNMSRTGNAKVIGLGNGATYVNATIAPKAAGYIAGILTFGGKPVSKALKGDYPGVPAYVAGKTAKKVAPEYEAINAALKDVEPLLQVVVNPATPLLSDLFADAWKQVLCKAYRFNNYKHTQYEGCKMGQFGVNELEPYTIQEDLDITRIAVEERPMGARQGAPGAAEPLPTLWYEYWPNELMDAAKVPAHSVPVMVLLHGNTNDPRTQAETSGFIQVAGRERFFVVEMEWQGSATAAAMGYDGIETTLYKLFAKYPQLDPSRVYAEGLSAGSMTATALGIRKSFLFTAVGGHSGGVFGGPASSFSNYESFSNAAKQMRGHVEMPYFSIGGTADTTVPYVKPDNWKGNGYLNAWNIYETLNGLPVVTELDFSIDPIFGMALENRHSVKTAKGEGLTMEIGDLCKDGKPLIRCLAVVDYGHWNFQPTAQEMWDFFKMYSRDPETKELIYHGK